MKHIIGHKNPDTDTVCSAIAYQDFLTKQNVKSKAFVLGGLNKETQFVLNKFKRLDIDEYSTLKGRLMRSKKPFRSAVKITPDFYSEELQMIIEVKGKRNKDSLFNLKWNMLKEHINGSGWSIALIESLDAMDDLVEIIKLKIGL